MSEAPYQEIKIDAAYILPSHPKDVKKESQFSRRLIIMRYVGKLKFHQTERNYGIKRILGIAIQVCVVWAIFMLLYFIGNELIPVLR